MSLNVFCVPFVSGQPSGPRRSFSGTKIEKEEYSKQQPNKKVLAFLFPCLFS